MLPAKRAIIASLYEAGLAIASDLQLDQVLAKEQEEALLYRDMQSDALMQLMRRLAAAKLQPACERTRQR